MFNKLFSKKVITPIKVEQPLPKLEEIPVKSFEIGSIYDALIKESNKLIEQVNNYNSTPRIYKDDRLDLLEENKFTNSLYDKVNNITYSQRKEELDNENKILKEKTLLKEAVEYYKLNYPSCKFILKEDVDKIIDNYGVTMIRTDTYKGFVPDEQLKVINGVEFLESDIVMHEECYDREETN